ncbi:unnamed protein product, partial [Allacma fusca]
FISVFRKFFKFPGDSVHQNQESASSNVSNKFKTWSGDKMRYQSFRSSEYFSKSSGGEKQEILFRRRAGETAASKEVVETMNLRHPLARLNTFMADLFNIFQPSQLRSSGLSSSFIRLFKTSRPPHGKNMLA